MKIKSKNPVLIILFISFFFLVSNVSAEKDKKTNELEKNNEKMNILLPKDLTWTDRYIIDEQKNLRNSFYDLKLELTKEIQKKEFSLIERTMDYSSNTLNFLFILISGILTILGLVGWKVIKDIKREAKNGIDKEIDKVIKPFKKKIKKLEEEQERSILWRNLYLTDSDNKKLDILKEIESKNGNVINIKIERSNIYLRTESFHKVIEICDFILKEDFKTPTALYNRAFAYYSLKEYENGEKDLTELLKISPDYTETIKNEKVFKKFKIK